MIPQSTQFDGVTYKSETKQPLPRGVKLQGIVRLSIDLFNPGADISSFNVVD